MLLSNDSTHGDLVTWKYDTVRTNNDFDKNAIYEIAHKQAAAPDSLVGDYTGKHALIPFLYVHVEVFCIGFSCAQILWVIE